MTLVGKIFTMLILVMSIMFMAFSMMVFATHKQWKEHAGKLQKDLSDLKTAQNDANVLKERLRNELAQEQAARKSVLAALQVRTTNAEQALGTTQQALDTRSAQLTKTVAEAETAQQRLLALETE